VIRAECSDLKGSDLKLALAPVAEIESERGIISGLQPFEISATGRGGLDAASKPKVAPAQPVPMAKAPEVAILLSQDLVASMKALRFSVKERPDGSLFVSGDFAGIDEEFGRRVYRVRAVYSWDASP
jgi:hypothetical protein